MLMRMESDLSEQYKSINEAKSHYLDLKNNMSLNTNLLCFLICLLKTATGFAQITALLLTSSRHNLVTVFSHLYLRSTYR